MNTVLFVLFGIVCAVGGWVLAWYRVRGRAIQLIREMLDAVEIEELANEPHHVKDRARFDALSDCLWHVGNRL